MSAAIDHPGDDLLSAGLRAIVDVALTRLVRDLELRPATVPDGLARLRGELRDRPVIMHAQAYEGTSFERLVLATIVDGAGSLRSVTIIGTPAAARGLPILGVDLIALGGALSLAAVDLAPTDGATWEGLGAPLLRELRAAIDGRVIARRRPIFAEGVFSPLAVIVGARRGEEAPVLTATAGLLDAFAAAVTGAAPLAEARAAAARRRVLAWCAAERRNRREHDALRRIFGADAGGRFLRYLFGDDGEAPRDGR
jgi:hypothetical protein